MQGVFERLLAESLRCTQRLRDLAERERIAAGDPDERVGDAWRDGRVDASEE